VKAKIIAIETSGISKQTRRARRAPGRLAVEAPLHRHGHALGNALERAHGRRGDDRHRRDRQAVAENAQGRFHD
jgi:hypothetical protein